MKDWQVKLARGILWQAAKDMAPDGDVWLKTDSCRSICATAGVDYDEYTRAVRYILERGGAQRGLLLQTLKKNIGA